MVRLHSGSIALPILGVLDLAIRFLSLSKIVRIFEIRISQFEFGRSCSQVRKQSDD